jgi:hypothetical protein
LKCAFSREFIINDEQWKFTDSKDDSGEDDSFAYMGFC